MVKRGAVVLFVGFTITFSLLGCASVVSFNDRANFFPIHVNYDLSVESLVAKGKYDFKNEYIISKIFQTTRRGEADLVLELVQLNGTFTSEEVIAELKERGLRPAELH